MQCNAMMIMGAGVSLYAHISMRRLGSVTAHYSEDFPCWRLKRIANSRYTFQGGVVAGKGWSIRSNVCVYTLNIHVMVRTTGYIAY